MRTLRFIAIALIVAALIAALFQIQKNPDLLLPSGGQEPKPETPSADPDGAPTR
jgi:hypothetical protein